MVANSTEETNKDNRFMSQQNRFIVGTCGMTTTVEILDDLFIISVGRWLL
jgi:hypothetical protein